MGSRLCRRFLGPLLPLLAAAGGTASHAALLHDFLPERTYLSLVDRPVLSIPGTRTEHDFTFRLPGHVRFLPVSQMHLILRAPPALWESLCFAELFLNGRLLLAAAPARVGGDNAPRQRWQLSVPLPETHLYENWNQLKLVFSHRKVEGRSMEGGSWEVHNADSFLMLAYSRMPLFPELRRFPDSLLEESLLRPAAEASTPVAAFLVPERRREAHVRALAVLGAVAGQPAYPTACHVGELAQWVQRVEAQNGVLVGTASELRSLPLPDEWLDRLNSLSSSEGLLAELIFGCYPHERRWLLVSGADDIGLEKAVLTLASRQGRRLVPPNPAVIERDPQAWLLPVPRGLAGTNSLMIAPASGRAFEFRGLHDTVRLFQGWQLPPGHETSGNGSLWIDYSASPDLQGTGSWLAASLNGREIGRLSLTHEAPHRDRVRFEVPPGLAAAGPIPLSFRAHLELPEADCEPPAREKAWVRVEPTSRLTWRTRPVEQWDLHRAPELYLAELAGRDLVLLLPARSTLDELEWLVDFVMSMGKRRPEAGLLWPEVVLYGPGRTLPASELRGRHVLLLGSVRDWEELNGPLRGSMVARPGASPKEVQLQGRRYPVERFEPSVALLNLVPAPWSAEEKLLVGGGWETYALPALTRLLWDPEATGLRYGLVSAMDEQGRSVSYDPRRGQAQAFGDRLLELMPRGLTLEETMLQRFIERREDRASARWNFALSVWTGALLVLLIAGRIWLLWERSRMQRSAERRWTVRGHA